MTACYQYPYTSDTKLCLTDAISRTTPSTFVTPFLSEDGRKAFYIYSQVGVTDQNTVVAELFDITANNKLVTKATITIGKLNGVLNFVNVDGGDASADFKLFTILVDNGKNLGRAYILNEKLEIKSFADFNDYNGPTGTFTGGVISPDHNSTPRN